MKIEYHILTLSRDASNEEILETLKNLSEDGWELVSTVPLTGGKMSGWPMNIPVTDKVQYIFKKSPQK